MPLSLSYNKRDRRTHHKRTKQRVQEKQTSWTWDKILDGKRSWTWEETLAGKDRLPWKQGEIAQEERRRYEGTRLARKPERQPQNKNVFGGTRGDWLSQVGDLSQLLMLTVGSV